MVVGIAKKSHSKPQARGREHTAMLLQRHASFDKAMHAILPTENQVFKHLPFLFSGFYLY